MTNIGIFAWKSSMLEISIAITPFYACNAFDRPKVYKKMEIEIRETTGPGSAHCIPTQIHDEECLEHAIEDSLGNMSTLKMNFNQTNHFFARMQALLAHQFDLQRKVLCFIRRPAGCH